MAKKAAAKAKAGVTSKLGEPKGVRSSRQPRAGATTRAANRDPLAGPLPRRARTVSSQGRPAETELEKLRREHEQALTTGQAQPHPTMAPRAARTAPDQGPIGRAHQVPQAIEGEGQEGVGKGGIRVRATRLGEYGFRRRRSGDTFIVTPRYGYVVEKVLDKDGEPKLTRNGRPITERKKRWLTAEEQLGDWMQVVGEDEPLRESTSKDVLNEKAGGRSRPSDGDTI